MVVTFGQHHQAQPPCRRLVWACQEKNIPALINDPAHPRRPVPSPSCGIRVLRSTCTPAVRCSSGEAPSRSPREHERPRHDARRARGALLPSPAISAAACWPAHGHIDLPRDLQLLSPPRGHRHGHKRREWVGRRWRHDGQQRQPASYHRVHAPRSVPRSIGIPWHQKANFTRSQVSCAFSKQNGTATNATATPGRLRSRR